MRIFLISLLIFAGFLPSNARAGNEPVLAAAPEWVEKPQIPSADPAYSQQPFQLLLFTIQTSHSSDGSTSYFETAGKVQSAEALTASGTIAIPWQPDRSDLIIHKLEVIRDGVPRDVLAGQKLSILRRESNLEAALLDGMLTATIQPEDLRVGDIVHFAYSIREKPGSIGFKPEDSIFIAPGTKGNLILVREIWPETVPMRWTATPGMGNLKARKTKLGNELRVELRNVEVPLPPPSAPARFAYRMYLEATAYRDWPEVSALLAPLYAKAATLSDSSPLKAEARQIAAAAPEPKARAMAALRLVQDKIRYLALQMNEGGYIPASADETWSRRFGDCKGKTVALLALLKELGIEAEPVLVNTFAGDVLPTRLPQAKLFNHVFVHAIIEGKSYWLDGARSGDRDLEELASSRYRFGLPLRGPGATLIALPLAPPLRPMIETKVIYDASAGIFAPANVQGETIFRGDAATGLRVTLAQIGEAEFKKGVNADAYLPGATDQVLRFKADPDQGTFTMTFSGHARMDWSNRMAPTTPRFRFKDSAIQWRPKFEGHEGADAQVPFLLSFPIHLLLREEVILPGQGKGYTLQGKSFDRTAAGTRIARSVTLDNGRAVATSTLIRLQPELPAREAQASSDALAQINEDAAYVVAPAGLAIPADEAKPAPGAEPKTADEFLARGYDRLDNQRREIAVTDVDRAIQLTKDALADFDRAIELAPASSIAHAVRALALIHLGRLDEAEVAIDKAHSFDNVHPRAFQARGLLHMRRGRPEKAIPDFSRYLADYNPDSAMALIERALAYEKTGALEKAKADLQRAVALTSSSEPRTALARVTARLGNVAEAIAMVDKIVPELDAATTPQWRKTNLRAIYRGRLLKAAGRAREAGAEYEAALREMDTRLKQLPAPSGPVLGGETLKLLTAKAYLLVVMDRDQEAIALADQALKLQPNNAALLVERCRARLHAGQLGKARQDCDVVRRTELANADAWYVSGLISLKSNDWDRALSEFQVLSKTKNPLVQFGRGLAKLRRGESTDGSGYLELVRSMSPDIDDEFERFGIKTESDADVAVTNAVPGITLYTWGSDGQPSRQPVTAEDFLARGYSYVDRLQSKDALSDFDRAIQLAPDSSLAHSLRALALVRLARLDEAEVAIDKALSRDTVEPRAFQIRGLLQARRGRPKDAIEDFSRNLPPEAASAIWLVERGLAYERTGQLEKARADLQRAVELKPLPQWRVLLARVTARLGNVQEAMAIVDKAVPGLDAANVTPWRKTYILALRRGSVLGMAGRAEEARTEYEAAIREMDARLEQLPGPSGPVLSGEILGLLKAKIDILVAADRAQEAIAVADRALASQPENASMLAARCLARLRAPGQLAKARQDCDAAQRNDPANQAALYGSGILSLKSNDWARATSEFQALAKQAPNRPETLFGSGIAKLRRGAKADGGADIEVARSRSAEIEAEFDKLGIRP
ncbi:MAG TPA: tetratricopeptide repeat protein [Allosphingosinicella sp.]|nr:tetratricopeptide repeat protein [Allosphingosinicella sp.]